MPSIIPDQNVWLTEILVNFCDIKLINVMSRYKILSLDFLPVYLDLKDSM